MTYLHAGRIYRAMTIAGSTIAVTGATGFIGRHIVDSLLRRGASVIAVVRNPDKVPGLKGDGVEIRRADLADTDALAYGFRGADAIVSNAALFRVGNRDWNSHLADNVRGTENVMGAAAAADCRRVVHVSSVAVYRRRGGGIIAEDAAKLTLADLTRFNAYPVSKAVSESRAWELAGKLGLALTCCRPAPVFGAWDPNITPLLRRLLARPFAPIPFGMQVGLVYAGDVAEGVAMMLEKDLSIGRAYNITGPHQPSSAFFRAWRDAGGPWPRLPIPVWIPIKRLWDNSRAESELGWKNRPWSDALYETFERETRPGS